MGHSFYSADFAPNGFFSHTQKTEFNGYIKNRLLHSEYMFSRYLNESGISAYTMGLNLFRRNRFHLDYSKFYIIVYVLKYFLEILRQFLLGKVATVEEFICIHFIIFSKWKWEEWFIILTNKINFLPQTKFFIPSSNNNNIILPYARSSLLFYNLSTMLQLRPNESI